MLQRNSHAQTGRRWWVALLGAIGVTVASAASGAEGQTLAQRVALEARVEAVRKALQETSAGSGTDHSESGPHAQWFNWPNWNNWNNWMNWGNWGNWPNWFNR